MCTYNQNPSYGWCARSQISEPSRGRRRMCHSMSVLQPSTLRRNCTEHKPGYLHAAPQWTHTATATPLQLTHMNVLTNVNGTYL